MYAPGVPHTFAIHTEFITLGQLIKAVGLIANGGEAKHFLSEAEVTVNGETENRRGRKIRPGDEVVVNGEPISVTARG